MTWPGPSDLVFSLKAFTAAMLAFWISVSLDLDRPMWAVFTVYLLMQPISGAVRSKSVYRFVGTVAGVVVTLVLVGLLADAPGLLFLVLGAVIVGSCMLAQIDLMPHGYAITLIGVTGLSVGLPSAVDPTQAFQIGMTRMEEIGLAVLCAVIVDSVIMPRPAGVVLNQRVAAWLDQAAALTRAALAPGTPASAEPGGPEGDIGARARLGQLAVDASALDALSTHVAYDTVAVRPDPRAVRLLHTRMSLLISSIFSSGIWLATLRAELPDETRQASALAAMRDWAAALPDPGAARTAAARAAIATLAPDSVPHGPRRMVLVSIGRLMDILESTWADCIALRRAIVDGTALPPPLRRASRTERLPVPYADPWRAVLVMLPAALAFLVMFAYWTVTGWDQGLAAVTMTMVAAILIGADPEPVRRSRLMVLVMVIASVLTLVYQFAVLPGIDGFVLLALVLGVFLVPLGAFIPITAGLPMLIAVMSLAELALQPDYDARFGPVADGLLGSVVGAALTAGFAWLLEAPGSAWLVARLQRVGWSDLAAIAGGGWRPDGVRFTQRAVGRFGVIAAQARPASPAEADARATALLAEIRVGLNMLLLHEIRGGLPGPADAAIGALLADLHRHFKALRRGPGLPAEALRRRNAEALAEAERAMPAPAAERAWLSLAGLQRWLFPSRDHVLPESVLAR